MNRSLVTYVILPFFLYGCGRAAPKAAAKNVGVEASPAIVISGSNITIDGKPVWLGDTLEAWKKAMPGRARCLKPTLVAVCIWDDSGIVIGSSLTDLSRVEYINIDLATEDDPVIERQEHIPEGMFNGYLELDGVSIDARTEYGEIRSRIDPRRKMGCGVRPCTKPTALLSPVSEIFLTLKATGDSGKLYSFSLGCELVKSCAALVPKTMKN
jgi:hypothetical protein